MSPRTSSSNFVQTVASKRAKHHLTQLMARLVEVMNTYAAAGAGPLLVGMCQLGACITCLYCSPGWACLLVGLSLLAGRTQVRNHASFHFACLSTQRPINRFGLSSPSVS